jgi:hypothetical protein
MAIIALAATARMSIWGWADQDSAFRVEKFPIARMKHSWNSEPQNIEQEISNDEVWNRSWPS